jgi:hypothetical protein
MRERRMVIRVGIEPTTRRLRERVVGIRLLQIALWRRLSRNSTADSSGRIRLRLAVSVSDSVSA